MYQMKYKPNYFFTKLELAVCFTKLRNNKYAPIFI